MTDRSMGILQQADEERARRKDNPVTSSKSKDNLCDDWPQIKARLEHAITDGPLHQTWLEDIRAALQRESEASRERDAFVAVLDPEGHNVVTAMVNARALRQRVEELEREGDEAEREYTAQRCRAEAAEAKLAQVVEAALDLVGEYESHGGKGTHQTCIPGAGCVLPQKVAALLAAAKGEE